MYTVWVILGMSVEPLVDYHRNYDGGFRCYYHMHVSDKVSTRQAQYSFMVYAGYGSSDSYTDHRIPYKDGA